MLDWKKFLYGAISLLFVMIITIACYGAVQSGDPVFIVVGILGMLLWFVIVGRTYMHHNGENPKHNNYL